MSYKVWWCWCRLVLEFGIHPMAWRQLQFWFRQRCWAGLVPVVCKGFAEAADSTNSPPYSPELELWNLTVSGSEYRRSLGCRWRNSHCSR